jgi:ribonuclease P protein component
MYTFKKEERLCNKKLIDGLFHNGSSFLCYPFKVSWLFNTGQQQVCAQVLFSVSKRRFKHAVDRNLIKRRMREAYRLNKQQQLYDVLAGVDKQIVLSLGYIGKGIEPYELIEKKMLKLLIQLSQEVNK